MATTKSESTEAPVVPASDADREAAAEAGKRLVWVEILRPYFRGGALHKKGALIQVPQYALKGITGANPPFGKQVKAPNT